MTSPLWIIVLTYNSGREINQCVRSIERPSGVRVMVIDNNSSDDTRSVLRTLSDEGLIDRLILRESNAGFAKAINEAIAATPNDSDVLLLNPDAILDCGSLEQLRSAASELRDVGILSPLVYSGNTVKTTTAGRQPFVLPMLAHFTGLSRLCRRTSKFKGRYLYLDGQLQSVEPVEWVAGACMYIKRETIERIGVLSERWFMYAEDTEYCWRALTHGLSVVMLTDIGCFHAMGQSVKRSPSDDINVMWPRSLSDYYKTTFDPSPLTFAIWRTIFSLGLLSRSIVFFFRGRQSRNDALLYEARRFAKFAGAVWANADA
ncbi:glycosyltransferase [Mycolicibacterium litorale]|uniref:glycosyltransferase n=1 Tax=Mycolicibacterium litorale TaxID=758802 RepID=UPI0010D72F7C|nr:glycosyltransferase family 2 protein [Mycolicibacterium litorale]TDY09674.1 GT2 family glycosyltransferase [Mycolicibacterium litorale]